MSPDFSELLRVFNEHDVEYLVIGAHAVAAYGHVRATKDLDVWIRPEQDNAGKVVDALKAYGAPLQDLKQTDLVIAGTIFQIGIPPLRIDILTSIDGVDFSEAWIDRFQTTFGNQPAPVISRRHLVINKKASGRLQDLADVEKLEDLS